MPVNSNSSIPERLNHAIDQLRTALDQLTSAREDVARIPDIGDQCEINRIGYQHVVAINRLSDKDLLLQGALNELAATNSEVAARLKDLPRGLSPNGRLRLAEQIRSSLRKGHRLQRHFSVDKENGPILEALSRILFEAGRDGFKLLTRDICERLDARQVALPGRTIWSQAGRWVKAFENHRSPVTTWISRNKGARNSH